MPSEPVEHADQMRGKTHAYGHVADSVFKNQIPADDPGDQLSHCRVRVGVRASSNRNHRGEFCVAQCCEAANDCHQHQRQR